MASPISHAVAALSIGTCFYQPGVPKRVWAIGAFCSVLPDVDVIGFRFGILYGDFWGHRGFTHSLFAAIVITIAAVILGFRGGTRNLSPSKLWTYLFLAVASHGFLDAMTDGGLGVAFFSPFDNQRYFFPWRPIRVSPISMGRFFTERGIAVLRSEVLWIWIPFAILTLLAWSIRRRRAIPF
jgi:inner membrane protein